MIFFLSVKKQIFKIIVILLNSFDKTKDKNILNENKKILINQVEFEKFCKEVNEILQC